MTNQPDPTILTKNLNSEPTTNQLTNSTDPQLPTPYQNLIKETSENTMKEYINSFNPPFNLDQEIDKMLKKVMQQDEQLNQLYVKLSMQDKEIEELYKNSLEADEIISKKQCVARLISKKKKSENENQASEHDFLSGSKDVVEEILEQIYEEKIKVTETTTKNLASSPPIMNYKTNENRQIPDKSALLLKIPDEIFQRLRNSKLEQPVYYKKSDYDFEPWRQGYITNDRFRYGMDVMHVTDKQSMKTVKVPYDSIALDVSSNQENINLVKNMSLCQKLPSNNMCNINEELDQTDRTIIPLFRTHRVFVLSAQKSAWIICRKDDNNIYVVYDDVVSLDRSEGYLKQAALDREEDAKIAHQVMHCNDLYDDPSYSFISQKSINGIDLVNYREVIPIMGQLYFYDGAEKMAIDDFQDNFEHLWSAPLIVYRIRKFDKEFDDRRKHSKWRHWYDTTYSLLVTSTKKKGLPQKLEFQYEHLNLTKNEVLRLKTGELVKVVEIDEFNVFFKVLFLKDGHTEWLHPVSPTLPTANLGASELDTKWSEVMIETLQKTKAEINQTPLEIECTTEKSSQGDDQSSQMSLHLESIESNSQISESDMENIQEIKLVSEANTNESSSQPTIVNEECSSSMAMAEIDQTLIPSADDDDETSYHTLSHSLIHKKKTIRKKMEITMNNLSQILTNPLDTKLPEIFNETGPLLIPLKFSRFYGNWSRSIENANQNDINQRKIVKYSYNGNTISNVKELSGYLKECNDQVYLIFYNQTNKLAENEIPMLTFENFCFDPEVSTESYDAPDLDVMECVCPDVSKSKEAVPIPAYVRKAYPDEARKEPTINYINAIQPSELAFQQLRFSLRKEMMPCCDCQDGCIDPKTCSCALRMREVLDQRRRNQIRKLDQCDDSLYHKLLGYKERRLQPEIKTGDNQPIGRTELPGIAIIECGPNCSCMMNQKYNSPCGNRVVQCGIRQILYIELMTTKGWGVRTRYDIPAGTFISTYTAKMYTNEEADEVGKKFGDTFLCDLDYIEVGEKFKGELYEKIESAYESDSSSNSNSTSTTRTGSNSLSCSNENSETEESRNDKNFKSRAKNSRPRRRNKPRLTRQKKSLRQHKEPKKEISHMYTEHADITSRTRQFYLDGFYENKQDQDKMSDKFVLDAMTHGNVGRYFNHSCDPNMAILNTFTYTQDLRFPVLAFFTKRNIKAGEELTWCYAEDYKMTGENEDLVTCICLSANCNGRVKFKKTKFVNLLNREPAAR